MHTNSHKKHSGDKYTTIEANKQSIPGGAGDDGVVIHTKGHNEWTGK